MVPFVMARTLPQLGEEQVKALQIAWNKDCSPKLKVRLQVLRLVARHEHTAEEIADIAGVSRATVFNHLDRFMSGGVEGLLATNYKPGRKSPIPAGVSERLAAQIATDPMRTASQIQAWLKKHERLSVKLHAVYYWLGKAMWVLKMPRKTHVKKDAAKSVEFRETLAEKLAVEGAGAERVRVWVADEHRHGLIPVIRSVWAPKGMRITAPYMTKYEWFYAYEALEIDGAHDCECLLTPGVNKAISGQFLEQIAEADPQARHIVIWDGAGFHPRNDDVGLPANVRIITLPAYSPELSPVEALGDIVKDRICNRVFEKLEDLQEQVVEGLRPFFELPEKVRRLIPDWMLDQANVIATR